MTNLSLANLQESFQSEEKVRLMSNPISTIVQAIFPANTRVEKETGFLDAWFQSNNGQG